MAIGLRQVVIALRHMKNAALGALHAAAWPGAINIVQKVTLTRPFLLCDREVSVGLFKQFINDPDYPGKVKAPDWPGADSVMSPTADHPIQRVDWNDAGLFCNWKNGWRTDSLSMG